MFGPEVVGSNVGPEYVIANLVTHKERSVHASCLRLYIHDPSLPRPVDTSRRDYMEHFVEKIVNHAGGTKKSTSMSFHLKWLNYDDTHNTWEPWKEVRLCEALHVY